MSDIPLPTPMKPEKADHAFLSADKNRDNQEVIINCRFDSDADDEAENNDMHEKKKENDHSIIEYSGINVTKPLNRLVYNFGLDGKAISVVYHKDADIVTMSVGSKKKKTTTFDIPKLVLKEIEMSMLEVQDAVKAWSNRSEENEDLLFLHVGARVYLTVNKEYDSVNVRYWNMRPRSKNFLPPNPYSMQPVERKHLYPTCSGLALTFNEWEQFKAFLALLKLHSPEFDSMVPCAMRDDHYNQLGYLQCTICNPYFHEYYTN